MLEYNRGRSELEKRKEIRREDIQEGEGGGEVSACMEGMTEY